MTLCHHIDFCVAVGKRNESGVKHVALLGGSFNPVHAGHTMLANYLIAYGGFDEVWMVLSPQNPLKDTAIDQPGDFRRWEMLNIALEGATNIRPCDIELYMPRPSYSIDTLRVLSSRYPSCRFTPVIGADNWLMFERWRSYQAILSEYGVAVYPRPGFPVDVHTMPEQAVWIDAPVVDISSTWIRSALRQGRDMNYFLPHGVYKYIMENNLYR